MQDQATQVQRPSSRGSARRLRAKRAIEERREDFAELEDALGHWLTAPRVDQFGAHLATVVARHRAVHGANPRWGQVLTESGISARLPFAAPDDFNAAARQRWRNVTFHAIMNACRNRGWVNFGAQQSDVTPGRRWRPQR